MFFLHFMLYCFLDLYEFLHQGPCAGTGWKGPKTIQENIDDCRHECAKRSNVGYFAYSTSNRCVCYLAGNGCPDDDKYDNYNAFRIVREGIILFIINSSTKCIWFIIIPFDLVSYHTFFTLFQFLKRPWKKLPTWRMMWTNWRLMWAHCRNKWPNWRLGLW